MDLQLQKLKSMLLMMIGLFLVNITMVFAQKDMPTTLYADLKNDGVTEKIQLKGEMMEDGRLHPCTGFDIFDPNGKKTFSYSPVANDFVRLFEVDQLRADEKKQLIVYFISGAALRMGDFKIFEWVDGKYKAIFSTENYGSIEFNDIKNDGNKEVIVNSKGELPKIFEYSMNEKAFVNSNGKYKEYYRDCLKKEMNKGGNDPFEIYRLIQLSYFAEDNKTLRDHLQKYYSEILKNETPYTKLPSEETEAENFLVWKKDKKDRLPNSVTLLSSYCVGPFTDWAGDVDVVKYYRTKLGLRALKVDTSIYDDEGKY